MRIASGSTTTNIFFEAVDETDGDTPETGLDTFTVYFALDDGSLTAFTTPTVTEVDSSNAPGIYRLLVDEGTTIESGFDTQELLLVITHAGMKAVRGTVELYRPKGTVGNTLAVSSGGVAQADVAAISGSTTAADNLEAGALGLVPGVCAASSTSTTIETTLTEATSDHYKGRIITFLTGALAGQSTDITAYNGSTKALTVTALTEAPAETDTFVIS